MFRGCEKGASGNPKIKTQDAPKEPSTSATENVLERSATALIATNPPNQASIIALAECLGGSLVLSPFSFSKKFIQDAAFLLLPISLFDCLTIQIYLKLLATLYRLLCLTQSKK